MWRARAFTLIIEDPMDHSFAYSPATDGFEDDDLVKELYTASRKEDQGLSHTWPQMALRRG